MKLFKYPALIILFQIIALSGFAQQQVRGVVKDQYGNGVPGVVVSDGFNVVKSSQNGEFSFSANERARFVFISTPDGYRQDESFYYRIDGKFEKPQDYYSFSVYQDGDINPFFVHIGDTEARIHKDWVDILKEYVAFNNPAFVVFNGDICYENGLKFHSRELTSKNLGTRAVYTLGNHDLVDGAYGEELYEQLFGPVWYSFNSNGVHFVNIPVLQGDRKPSYTADDVYGWLKKNLDAIEPGMPVVLMNHHFVGYADNFLLQGEKEVVNLLDYNFKAYLYAHYHINFMEQSPETGVLTVATMSPNKGGIDHTPSSFRVLYFDEQGNLDSQVRYSPIKGHIAANIIDSDGVVSEVVANVYDARYKAIEVVASTGGFEYSLEKVSDWTWRGEVAAGETVMVHAYFDRGSLVQTIATDPAKIGVYEPTVKWVSSLGGSVFMTSPLDAGDLVITSRVDENTPSGVALDGRNAIVAVRKSDGGIEWEHAVAAPVKNNLALWNGVVVAADMLGNLYAINAADGSLKWKRALREKEIHPVLTQGVAVSEGVVYAGHGHYLTAVCVNSGDIIWKNSAWRGGVCTVASPVVEPESNVLLTAAYWTGRFAHDALTGKLLWEKRDNDTRIADNSPVHFKGKFYYASPEYIMEVDPVSGEELVKHKINYTVNNNSRPLVTDNLFIVGTTDKGVVAFDHLNGYKELWNFKTNPGLFYTAPYTKDFQMTVESGVAMHDNVIYFGANDGYLYSLYADTGVFRWRINIGAPILGNILIVGDVLYLSDFAGNMWAISAP